MLVLGRPAAAHAVLIGSDPQPGAVLPRAPSAVTLRFEEELAAPACTAQVFDAHAAAVAGVVVRVVGRELRLALPPLGDGTYTVLWQARTAADAHPASGQLVFSVDTAAQAGAVTPEGLMARWVALALLAGTLGGIVLAAVVRPKPAADPRLASVYRRGLTLAARCAAAGALFGLVRLNDERLRATAGLWRLVAATAWGWRWIGVEAAFVALLLLARKLRRDGRRRWWAGVTGAALVAGTCLALATHASGPADPRGFAVAVATAHILAGTLWLGVALALGWVAGAAGTRALPGLTTSLVRLTAVSFGLVVASGLIQAGLQMTVAGELFGTRYGQLVLLKWTLTLAVVALALRLRRPIGRETSAGLTVVLLLAGVLGLTPPPAAQRVAATTTATASARDLLAAVSVTPAGSGTAAFDVTVTSSRRPPPAPVDAVTLRVAGRAVALRPVDGDRFVGVGFVGAGFAGGPVSVELMRAGELLRVPLQLPAAGPRPGRPLAPLLDVLAVLVLVVAARASAGTVNGPSRLLGPGVPMLRRSRSR
ncbi:copper resistance protein CopC [Dactylosporangium sp. NPDC049140]|uniref:copper resistance CopC/CopD family protein n=1 Tax=Dactylosporangium sp. NPDC049140 TaxID=3155647 RepID=UPI003406E068